MATNQAYDYYPSSWEMLTPEQRARYGYAGPDPELAFNKARDFNLANNQRYIDAGLETQVDPEIVAKLLSALSANPSGQLLQGEGEGGQTFTLDPAWSADGYSIGENGNIGKSLQKKTWGQDVGASYGPDGKLIGIDSGDSTALGLAKFIAMSAAAYGGVNALGGGAAPAAGASGGGMADGAFLGEGVASGVPAWDAAAIKSAAGSGQLGTAGSYLGQTFNGGTGLETIGSALGSGAGSAATTAVKGAGSGLNMGGLLGAAAGALDSRDSEQKQSRDPWEPAQPFLRQQIAQGQDLSNRYQAQPFSRAQQTAYGNMGGLLDAINANAGGLLGGYNANASGANQFVRGQRPTLTGSQFNLSGLMPGLLGSYGTRG